MTIPTTYRDDVTKGVREAWQNGVVVCTWTYHEIERMHEESPDTVPAFGTFNDQRPFGWRPE